MLMFTFTATKVNQLKSVRKDNCPVPKYVTHQPYFLIVY